MRFGFGLGLTDGRAVAGGPTLASYYGTGLGQIPLHLAPEDAVLDGNGNVVSFPNSGGAGAAFNGTPTNITITRSGNLLTVSGASTGTLILANAADLVGAHLFIVAALAPGIERTRTVDFAGRSAGAASGDRAALNLTAGGQLNAPRWDGTAWISHTGNVITLGAGLRLIEIAIAGGQVLFWLDGVAVGSRPFGYADFLLNRLLGTSSSNGFLGQVGDILSMITDGSAAMGTRAAEIRAILGAKHGITLA